MSDLEKFRLKKTSDGYRFEKEPVDPMFIFSVAITCGFIFLFLYSEELRAILYDILK